MISTNTTARNDQKWFLNDFQTLTQPTNKQSEHLLNVSHVGQICAFFSLFRKFVGPFAPPKFDLAPFLPLRNDHGAATGILRVSGIQGTSGNTYGAAPNKDENGV